MSSSDARTGEPDEQTPGTGVSRPLAALAAAGVQTMPLSMVRAGTTVRVHATSGKDEMRRRLSEMGFVADTEVTVVSELRGNVIVSVKGVRLAISRSAAHHVLTTDSHTREGQDGEGTR